MDGWQWTGSVQRRLPANMVVEAQYVGSHWENEMFEADINHCLRTSLEAVRPRGRFRSFRASASARADPEPACTPVFRTTRQCTVLLKKPFGYGVSADVSYTWSRLKDDMDTSGWGNQFGAVYYQDAFNPSANYAVSNFDRPNSFKGSISIRDTAGKRTPIPELGSSGCGDRRLASVNFLHSRIGISVHCGYELCADSVRRAGRMRSGIPTWLGIHMRSISRSTNGSTSSLTQRQQPNTFGNNPRNSLRGPDLTDVDFSLAKTWGMPGWEQGKLQLRMDAINVLNHPSFRNPSNDLNPNALTSGVPDPSVGAISGTTITGRIVQLSARFSF